MINATNGASQSLQNSLYKTNRSLNNIFQRLSSGKKLNKASDDAAAIAISEALSKQSRGIDQGTRNTVDGINMLNTADSAAQEQTNILQRMGELANQASNGTLSDEQRGYLQNEFTQLREQFDQIATTTEFNGKSLLDGSSGSTALQTGDDAGENVSVDLSGDQSSAGVGINALSITTQAGAQAAMGSIETATNSVLSNRSRIGASINRLEATVERNRAASLSLVEANATISDTDFASAMANLVKSQVNQQAGTAMLGQAANASRGIILGLLS